MYTSKFVAPEIIFEKGSLGQVGFCCKRLGASRVFLVADQKVIKCGWIKKSKGE
ncbi:MAG: iron-containing alcohol dehydrogenase [Firmicutes bacterium]|nr:iron-containing alcohol dehydrogenase [Bacillota bacterium]